MSERDDQGERRINAENESIAFDSMHISGNVRDIHIGHTKNYLFESEEDVPLTSEKIEVGLTRFAEYLLERATILTEQSVSIAKKLRATLGADLKFLSEPLKDQRKDTLKAMHSS